MAPLKKSYRGKSYSSPVPYFMLFSSSPIRHATTVAGILERNPKCFNFSCIVNRAYRGKCVSFQVLKIYTHTPSESTIQPAAPSTPGFFLCLPAEPCRQSRARRTFCPPFRTFRAEIRRKKGVYCVGRFTSKSKLFIPIVVSNSFRCDLPAPGRPPLRGKFSVQVD